MWETSWEPGAVSNSRTTVMGEMDSKFPLRLQRTKAGLMYIQGESFQLNRQNFLTIYSPQEWQAGPRAKR